MPNSRRESSRRASVPSGMHPMSHPAIRSQKIPLETGNEPDRHILEG
jgi:hypothetical protein